MDSEESEQWRGGCIRTTQCEKWVTKFLQSPAKSVNHLIHWLELSYLRKYGDTFKKINCRAESFILHGLASPSGDVPRLWKKQQLVIRHAHKHTTSTAQVTESADLCESLIYFMCVWLNGSLTELHNINTVCSTDWTNSDSYSPLVKIILNSIFVIL